MKILSLPEKWSAKVTCHDCGAVLEIEFSDVILYTGTDVDESEWQVVCPNCEAHVRVDDTIPHYLKRFLLKKHRQEG